MIGWLIKLFRRYKNEKPKRDQEVAISQLNFQSEKQIQEELKMLMRW